MVFEEIEHDPWSPQEEGDSITGVLLNVKKDVGPNNAMLYTLSVDEKSKVVWGSTILDDRMMSCNIGDIVRITYKGLGEKKPGQNAVKIFKVERDKVED